MMRGSPEKQTVNPQEVDKGRRRLLAGAAALAGTILAIDAASKTEPAYAAVKKFADFRDRRGNINSTNSPSLDTQVTTQSITQREPVNIQDTPTPDLQATKTALDIQSARLTIQKQQTDNALAFVTDIVAPVGTAVAIGTLAYSILRGQHDQRMQEQTRLDERRKENERRMEESDRRRDDQRIDREKRDEDRFREAVLDLGKDETKLGAATTLRTFLDKKNKESYQRFYQQIFDLSVGYLRLRNVEKNPEPDPFYREIIRVFCESTPLVREMLREMLHLQTLSQSDVPNLEIYQRKFINASHIHLENADLPLVDLKLADLTGANLVAAYLGGADLSEADLTRANPEEASTLKDTHMWNVKNYDDPVKRQKCIGKGATFDPPAAQPKTRIW